MKKVLIINPIVYTSETKNIKKVPSIKDSMIYDLCLGFQNRGYDVTLFAAKPYEPTGREEYPFEIVWADCVLPEICLPHRLPVLSGLRDYIKKHRDSIDLIISSEVFSVNSLIAYWTAPKKVLIWHELAKHNALFKKIPSKIWYNGVARLMMPNVRVVARSAEARSFIKRYCRNVCDFYIDHGVNLDKFQPSREKKNYFVVCSQLIPRKRIDGIIDAFAEYLKKYDADAKLYIAGNGTEEEKLKCLVKEKNIGASVIFLGKISHDVLQPLLSHAKALLVNTEKDNSMISIVESIAVGTPVLTTDVPLNSEYIRGSNLGIAKQVWDEHDLNEIAVNNGMYVKNCMEYREKLSTGYRVSQFFAAFFGDNAL